MTTRLHHYYAIADLLLAIEAEMRRIGIWETISPSSDQLLSVEPFCLDTLRFTQWLQFVLLPRIKVMVEMQAPLPEACNICAYAEEALIGVEFETIFLFKLLKEFDRAITRQ
jgi:uncharacterized protein YqcC (DUF446 family)